MSTPILNPTDLENFKTPNVKDIKKLYKESLQYDARRLLDSLESNFQPPINLNMCTLESIILILSTTLLPLKELSIERLSYESIEELHIKKPYHYHSSVYLAFKTHINSNITIYLIEKNEYDRSKPILSLFTINDDGTLNFIEKIEYKRDYIKEATYKFLNITIEEILKNTNLSQTTTFQHNDLEDTPLLYLCNNHTPTYKLSSNTIYKENSLTNLHKELNNYTHESTYNTNLDLALNHYERIFKERNINFKTVTSTPLYRKDPSVENYTAEDLNSLFSLILREKLYELSTFTVHTIHPHFLKDTINTQIKDDLRPYTVKYLIEKDRLQQITPYHCKEYTANTDLYLYPKTKEQKEKQKNIDNCIFKSYDSTNEICFELIDNLNTPTNIYERFIHNHFGIDDIVGNFAGCNNLATHYTMFKLYHNICYKGKKEMEPTRPYRAGHFYAKFIIIDNTTYFHACVNGIDTFLFEIKEKTYGLIDCLHVVLCSLILNTDITCFQNICKMKVDENTTVDCSPYYDFYYKFIPKLEHSFPAYFTTYNKESL